MLSKRIDEYKFLFVPELQLNKKSRWGKKRLKCEKAVLVKVVLR